nr:hypothetical protein [Caulobacteraceae bacterium]
MSLRQLAFGAAASTLLAASAWARGPAPQPGEPMNPGVTTAPATRYTGETPPSAATPTTP